MKKPVILLILFAVTVSGCATVATLAEDEPKNKIFSGTRTHVSSGCGCTLCIDLPFSLAADIVALPYTVPKTISTSLSSKENPKEGPIAETKSSKSVTP